jgi:hypothetical protein
MAADDERKGRTTGGSDQAKGEVREHPLVSRLVPDPGTPAEATVKLAGYVGKAMREGHLRLYPSLDDLSSYLEIRREDVVHAEEVPESVMEHGGTYLWVKESAELVQGQTQATKIQAQFLGGGIAAEHLGAAEFGGAVNLQLYTVVQCPITRITCFRTICQLTCFRTCLATCLQTVCYVTCRTCLVWCYRTIIQATCLKVCGVFETARGCQSVFGCPTLGACPSIQCGGGGGFDPGPMF